jgi:hypothetical protein
MGCSSSPGGAKVDSVLCFRGEGGGKGAVKCSTYAVNHAILYQPKHTSLRIRSNTEANCRCLTAGESASVGDFGRRNVFTVE